MKPSKWRVHNAQGEHVFLEALKDFGAGDLPGRKADGAAAKLISLLVLLIPVVVLSGGAAIVASALPSLAA